MALTCPQCSASMNEVTAQANSGYLIVLDQCPRCGGIWCDRWELYPITAAAAARLDRADQEALWQPTAAADEVLKCPRCKARMSPFHDRALPPDARIERCPNCDGMWLNRGELRRFKLHDGSTSSPRAAVSQTEVDRLSAQVSGDGKSWPTVSNLDAAFDASEPIADDTDVRREVIGSAVWLIARAALRLLLHI